MNLDLTILIYAIVGYFLISYIFKAINLFGRERYQKKEYFFTDAERIFYRVLKKAVGEKYEIFGQVRVADVLLPISGLNKKNWLKAFYKVSSKHFDYVLCHKGSLKIAAAIELDDRSHEKRDRIKRDIFLNKACESAGLTLYRIKNRRKYSVNEIRQTLNNLDG